MTLLETILSSIVGGSAIVVAIITWVKERKTISASATKTNAESVTALAEATKLNAEAQSTIADSALAWSEKLFVELDKMKVTCDKQKVELDDAWHKLRDSQDIISQQQREVTRLTESLALMEKAIDTEKKQCERITNELYDLIKNLKDARKQHKSQGHTTGDKTEGSVNGGKIPTDT